MNYLLGHNFQLENFAQVSGQHVRFLPNISCSEARRSCLNQGSKRVKLHRFRGGGEPSQPLFTGEAIHKLWTPLLLLESV